MPNVCEGEKTDSLNLSSGKGIAYYHDGMVYIFPEKKRVGRWEGVQKGNWKRVAAFYDTTEVEKEVFRLWLEHTDKGGKYSYVIVPEKGMKIPIQGMRSDANSKTNSVKFVR